MQSVCSRALLHKLGNSTQKRAQMLKTVNCSIGHWLARTQLSDAKKYFISNICELKLRHTTPLVHYFSFHHIFTNAAPISSCSVCYSLSAVAHTKKYRPCWIDKNFHLYHNNYFLKCKTNCISANYQSRRNFVSLENSKKMVWITDLDDPKVDLLEFSISFT